MADVGLARLRDGSTAGASGSIALLVVDDDCRVAEASLAGCRLLGLARSELLGRPLGDVLTPAAADRLAGVWGAFHDTGGHAGPFELASPNAGAAIDISVTSAVLSGRHLVVLSVSAEPDGSRPPVNAPSTRQSDWGTPTAREREILSMLAGGDTDVQVAGKLALSPATVQTHVRNAKAKLGARTRAQAVAMALRQGIIPSG